MGKTITLSDPIVESLFIDVEKQAVVLKWKVDLPDGRRYQSGEFIFYRTMPDPVVIGTDDQGNPLEGIPDTWQELNTTAKAALTTLVTLAQTFLTNQDL